jgi:NADPH-dependent 2,4-dienoyl-CoA reductase/sulfur reductase-like enzyme/rhodanese-related sulfurtransferase
MASPRKVVIVGGVAGGATAAARLRRLDESAHIVLLERGEHVSFANCGLPYHVGGVIPERDKLLLMTPQRMRERLRIDVRVRHEVLRIDRARREVEVRDLTSGGLLREPYEHLVLSTGAAPVRPPVPGGELPGIFTLRSLPDMDALLAAARARPGGRAVVVGGGFIGLELAENLRHRGLAVTLVEMGDQVMTPLDRELAALVHHALREAGVDLRLQEAVTGFAPEGEGLSVRLRSGEVLSADLVSLSIGVRPEARLAAEAGLALGPRGGVRVDASLRTSDPHISAIGDVAEVPALHAEGTTWVPLAGPANRQGRLVADVLAGKPVRYGGAQATGIAQVFALTVGSTGKNEAALRREGTPFLSALVHGASHAGYYPGATPLTLKLHFSPEGRLLGAQAVGREGVDKRLDVLAAALRLGASVDDLAGLELAYAPPFSSAKDPVNILGYVAGNLLHGEERFVDWREVLAHDPRRAVLLDVREAAERNAHGFLEGSVHIPLGQLRARHAELPRDRPIHVYCQVGQRAHTAVRLLVQLGYGAANVAGGYRTVQAIRDDLAPGVQAHRPAGRSVAG